MPDGTLSSVASLPALAEPAPSMPVDLRPLTTSELIDRGFSLYRAHFAGFVLIALLGQSAPLLAQIFVTTAKLYPSATEILEQPSGLMGRMLIISAILILSQIIVFAFRVAVTFYISEAYLGSIPSVSRSLKRLITGTGSTFWTCVLGHLLVGLSLIFPFGVVTAATVYFSLNSPLTTMQFIFFILDTGLCLIVSMAPVLIVFMRLMLTVPALALENLGGWRGAKRSSTLVRFDPGLGFFYWGEMRLSFLLLPLFVIELLVLTLTSLPVIVFQVTESVRHGSIVATPPDATLVMTQVLTFLLGSLIWPLYPIATALFYYDVRIRREGFDLEFIARQLRGTK